MRITEQRNLEHIDQHKHPERVESSGRQEETSQLRRVESVKPTVRLEGLEERTLQLICNRFGHTLFSLEMFLQTAPRDAAPAAYHAALIQLCRKQVISMMRKTWGERLYQYPVADYFEYIRQHDARAAALEDQSIDDQSIGVYARRRMSELLLSLVLEVEQAPLKVTKQGRLYKKDMEKLASRLGTASAAAEELVVLEAYDLALRIGLIERAAGEVTVNVQRFMIWLDLDSMTRELQLFQIWYRVHDPQNPILQWITAVVRSLPGDRWAAERTLLDSASHESMEMSASEITAWLERLYVSGWVDLGLDDSGSRWLRNRTGSQEIARTLIVQQDLEIIAPQLTSFKVIRGLHQIAERLDWDHVQRYKISADTLYRAFDAGWTSDSVIEFLADHAVDALSEEFVASIRRWESSRTQVRLIPGIVLQADDERAVLIMKLRAYELGAIRLNEQMWLVANGEEREVKARFERAGLTIATGRSDANGEISESDAHQGVTDLGESGEPAFDNDRWVREALLPDAPGIFAPQDASELYHKELPDAAQDELYPDVRKIPAMWVEQFRHYHPSTILDMIRQAIGYRTGILVRIANQELEFIPDELEQSGVTYVVKGYRDGEVGEISIEEIECIKLLLPGLLV